MKNYPESAVLILFFTRKEPLEQVFEAVRKRKPKKLYLFQDGPRENRADDVEKIQICRQVVENIDWECEVHRHYCESNMGCDPAEYAAVSWALETEDRIIRLEDDNVPSQSFFDFCDEMLERYKDDKRIFMVCGRNQLGKTNYNEDSYFFSTVDSIWGFATWKDRWDMLDHTHSFLEDEYLLNAIKNKSTNKYETDLFINKCRVHREDSLKNNRVSSYESAVYAALLLNNMLSIVPRVNMIRSAGMSADSVHTPASEEYVLKKDRWLYNTEAYELEFPLIHPKHVINNVKFYDERNKLLHISSKGERNRHKLKLAMNKRWVNFKKLFRKKK